jgi:hypothetical protein
MILPRNSRIQIAEFASASLRANAIVQQSSTLQRAPLAHGRLLNCSTSFVGISTVGSAVRRDTGHTCVTARVTSAAVIPAAATASCPNWIFGVISTAVTRDSEESPDWWPAAARRLTARAKCSATACRRSSLSIRMCFRRGVLVFAKLSGMAHLRPGREVSGFLGILSGEGLAVGVTGKVDSGRQGVRLAFGRSRRNRASELVLRQAKLDHEILASCLIAAFLRFFERTFAHPKQREFDHSSIAAKMTAVCDKPESPAVSATATQSRVGTLEPKKQLCCRNLFGNREGFVQQV